MNLVESLLHALKDRGVTHIFGIPGDFALAMFKVIEESGILPYHTLSHEPAVGFAADAAARLTGQPCAAVVTYGAGAFNMVNAVTCAFAEKAPLVVVSGAPGVHEARSGLLLHHQGDTLDSQYRVFSEITCAQARLDDPKRAPAEIARVLAAARRYSRPVYLEVPRDQVRARCGKVGPDPKITVHSQAVAACADDIMRRIRGASRPVLMVGVEVRRYGLEAKVADLARKLGLPVVTSFMGRGLLATHDVDVAGTYLGVAGVPEISALVEGSDGLVLMGVILSDTNFGVSAGKLDLRRTVHIFDDQVSVGFYGYQDIPLTDLVDALLERAGDARHKRRPKPPKAVHPTGLVEDDGPIAPNDIARAVNDLFARHEPMPIAADMGDCLFTAMEIEHTELMAPGYYATMGYGVPAGIGAQIAAGRRTLIMVGDGAFQMTGWELGNCGRLGIDPIVLLFNNTSWEMLRVFQPESRFNDLDDWHFADAMTALGGIGRRVRTRAELAHALEAAVRDRGRFQLIEIMVPRGQLSETLRRFVTGIKKMHSRQAG